MPRDRNDLIMELLDSRRTIEDLNKQLRDLEIKNSKLTSERRNTNTIFKETLRKNEKLTDLNNEIVGKNNFLVNDNRELELKLLWVNSGDKRQFIDQLEIANKNIETLNKELYRCQQANAKFQEKHSNYQALFNENNQLKRDNYHLLRWKDDLTDEKVDLELQLEKVLKENKQLKGEITELNKKNKKNQQLETKLKALKAYYEDKLIEMNNRIKLEKFNKKVEKLEISHPILNEVVEVSSHADIFRYKYQSNNY